MHALGRHTSRVQRGTSVGWSRQTEKRRSREAELVSKHSGELGETIVEVHEYEPKSPTSISPSTTRSALAADAWMECARALKDHDDAKIQGWKEEIDTHLVFAGLFSAILTAFNVEAYKLLLPQNQTQNQNSNDSSDSSTTDDLLRMLVVMTAQVNGMDLNTLALNTTAGPMSAVGNSGQNPNYNAVLINAFWFCSLICSLAAASISILVKQWLNQYSTRLASASPEIARLRQFRHDNLKKWKIEAVMMLLPILLQSALVLFLLGLIEFLLPLSENKAVVVAATVLIAALLAFLLVTTLLPTFMPDCAYQSPQAWGVFVAFQALKKPARALARRMTAYATRIAASHADGALSRLRHRWAVKVNRKLTRFADKPATYSWAARERILVEDNDAVLDQHMLVAADAIFLDDTLLRDVVQPCLRDMPTASAVQCYYDIMSHRADRVVGGVLYFDEHGTSRAESLAVLTDLSLDMLEKTRMDHVSWGHPMRILQILEPLLVRTLPLTYCHFCRALFSLLNHPERKVRQPALSILYQQLSRNLELAAQHASLGCHDFSALVAFISNARTDDHHHDDIKHFLDACDLVISLAILPGMQSKSEPGDSTSTPPDVCTYLRDTLRHLRDFFRTSRWKNEPRLLYSISRVAPHLLALQRRYPHVVEDELVDVLGDVAKQARTLNRDGNWEDKLMILEATLDELQALRQTSGVGGGSITPSTNEERLHTRRPSLMRSGTPLVMLDA